MGSIQTVLRLPDSQREDGKGKLFIAVPEQHLTHAAQLMELAKDAGDGLLHLAVGRLLDPFLFGAGRSPKALASSPMPRRTF